MSFLYKSAFVVSVAVLVSWLTSDDGFNPDELKGKRVMITGGSQNIGEEIALQYAKLGAKIVVTARREKELKTVVEECKKSGAMYANYIVADMSDLNQIKSVVDTAAEYLGGLDYLVLNHVIGLSNPGLWNGSEFNLNFAEKSATINYVSYVYMSTHATPYLKGSTGHVIVVSSLAGHVYTIYNAVYGATKAAINQFYSSLRLEMALQNRYDYSITICLLGPIATKKSRWEKYPDQVNIKGYPLVDTAKEIIRAGATSSSYIFIPKWTIVSGIQRAFATDRLDKLFLKLFYNK
ncbi:unnamed protein product [Clavelina lepadiformis]|uniref:Uncharacterized protein n=1 Tax=Clavelina lepadiformis TaxID=159417 RepID=A0ABP0GI70_CLALP